jgi:flagellar basal-body rod modification protein FlgD
VAISPITSDYGMFAANASSSTGQETTQADSDMFLKLMVAQMKYQDPMNPTDSSQMLTQNAIFTEVQAIQEMQSEMGLLLSSQLAFGSAAMVGQKVTWVDANGTVKSGTVDSVDFTTSGPVANVGDEQIPINSVASIGDRATTAPDPDSGSDSSSDSSDDQDSGTDSVTGANA